MVKIRQLLISLNLVALLINSYALSTQSFAWQYDINAKNRAARLPAFCASGLKIGVENLDAYIIPVPQRIKDATRRGSMYSHLRNSQNYKYFDDMPPIDGKPQLPKLNTNKENIDTLVQQAGYIVGDILVSEAVDKIANLELVKNIVESSSIQYFSNNISEENKNFFKDQLIFATSATLVNGVYQASEKSQALVAFHNNRTKEGYITNIKTKKNPNLINDVGRFIRADLYDSNKEGMSRAIGEVVAINSLDHFIVKKFIAKDWQEYSPVVSYYIGIGLIAFVKVFTEGVAEGLSQKK